MGKNVILPEQTVLDLLEAYASLSAWYYQLWAAVRSTNGTTEPPGEAARAAFIVRLGQDYPELAALARTITAPRPFVPPPPALPSPYADLDKDAGEPTTIIEPAPARLREMKASDPPPAGVAPPAPVAPPAFAPPAPVAPAAVAPPAPVAPAPIEPPAVAPPPVAPPPFVAPGTVKYNS